jgi:hypothetical protein
VTAVSPPDLLVLHAVRIQGMADDHAAAARYGLPEPQVVELLGDFEAYGFVSRHSFGDTGGWSLTAAGQARNEQQLAVELDAVGGRDVVEGVYADFLPSNAELQRASTDWQLRPTAADALAANRHDDPGWDTAVLDRLERLRDVLGGLEPRLVGVLDRFAGYRSRFGVALDRARSGELRWVTGVGIDSCHAVWMELHEDLLATLGRQRTG